MNIKRMLNKLIVLVCIIGLILPSISLVADAAFEDKENTVIKLGVSILHPKKDTKGNRFGYKIGDRITYRTYINKDGSIDYSTYIFCLNMNGKFPQEDGTKNSNYTSKGELKKENSPISEDNTKKILYLLKNSDLYGKFDDKISTVYAKRIEEDKDLIPPTTVDTIKGIITDDDLFFAMQVAIWEITNNLKITENAVTYTIDEKVYNGQGTYQSKADLIACAIEYYRDLVSKYNTSDSVNTNPSIKKTDKTTVEEENYLYVGPFHITSGTNNNFNVSFKDQDGKALTGYSLVDAQNSTGKKVVNIKTALDKDLYVKLPVLTTTTKIKMELDVTGKKENSVALWTSNIANAQPLVSVNPKNIHEETEAPITKKVKTYDVALRKYITKVNGTEISDTRVPVVTEQPLDAEYNKGDFKYSHRKDPVEVEAGQTVTYAIQIYNECENTVIVKGIKDYLPKGLELVKEDESNKSWTQIEGTNEIILSSDMQLDPVEIDSTGKKHAKSVIKEVTCRVKEDVEDGKILTNVAEVIGLTNKDGIDVADEDSNKLLSDASKDNPSYRGSTTESNLSRSDYYYFGEEDDDDFEKVVVKSKVEKQEIDLALRKYITTVNGENKDRKPEVNTDKLAKEEATTAEYNHPKTPVSVKTGDIVIYTIRVYNEGNEDAYVNEITDYIPEGLGFLVNHGINYNNGWKITTEDSKTVKLSDIANATKNISKTDFIDDGEVANEDVIVGKATIKTDILKYTEGGNKNKIPAFDKTSKEPSSVFVQVACVVVADKLDEKVVKNIAAITAEANKDGIQVSDKSDVKDRDSQPNEIDVNTYPENSNIQDDDDYEDLILTEKEYDLALKKFITTVKTPKADGTYDQVDYSTRLQKEDGTTLVDTKNGDYKLDKTLVKVKNGDTVVYTIRIYNEGEVEAIAKEVIDNLPEGLEFIEYVKDESGNFVSGSELNYKYGWEKFERESEKGWTSGLKTTYLSDKPIEAFDKENK